MTRQTCDFLIIGSGIAGLSLAIHASRHGSVVMVTKKTDSDTGTNHAQGGIACVLDPSDSFESHIRDTLVAGAGLCDESAVRTLVHEGPERVKELLNWGVEFSRSRKSEAWDNLDLGREGGHSCNRIVHAHDLTGQELEAALLRKVKSLRNVFLYENLCAVELITNHQVDPHAGAPGQCYGVYILDTTRRRIFPITAKITILATGGAGKVYRHTTNPGIATGDGVAMAYRAGARIANMEFIQFHPTMLYHEKANSFLISEAVRGHGAVLKNSRGEPFMDKVHRLKSLAPRDIVARAIDAEMKRTSEPCVYLDIRHIAAAEIRKRFPNIFARCKEIGIDMSRDLIPVVPAAHYLCGGIQVDINGNSSIANLYACGEVSCTGIHGANRLASNSLLEAIVFSYRSVNDAVIKLRHLPALSPAKVPDWDDSGTHDTEEWILLSHNLSEIQSVMWDYVGIVRSNVRLQRARRRIDLLEKEIEDYYRRTKITPRLLELRNVVTTARLIVASAIRRRESRGLHYTTDYPRQNDHVWKRDTVLLKPQRAL
jgi:L-aspartate oxidase